MNANDVRGAVLLNDPRGMQSMPPRVDEETLARVQEAQRIAMIEAFRQNCALHCMLGLVARADEDCNMGSLARRAKRAADALVAEVFTDA